MSDRFWIGQWAAVTLILAGLHSAAGADLLTVPPGTSGASPTPPSAGDTHVPARRYARHHIVVELADAAAEARFFTAARAPGLASGGRIYGSDWFIVELPAGLEARNALGLARALPGARRVALDPVVTLADHFVPNDPLYLDAGSYCDPLEGCYDQWGLFAVRAESGWHTTTGSPDVVIAVLDSGVDLDHDDLYANIWTNAGEIAGNGIDDDGNGIVDDVHGADFAGDNVGSPFDDPASFDGDPDVPEGGDWLEDEMSIFGIRFAGDPAVGDADDNNGDFFPDLGVFHGTAVAGIAAAMTNNLVPGSTSVYEGIAGACGRCRIMAVRIINAEGNAFASDAAAGLRYAADMGADILNASWGFDVAGLAPDAPELALLAEAIDDVVASGATIVAAAGNAGVPGVHYPAIDRRVIAVGSSNRDGYVSGFSSTGFPREVPDNGIDDDRNGWIDDVVDVVAPGEAIWSAWVLAAYDSLLYAWDPGTDTYSVADGTSFAAPLVAGYLGLLLSAHPGASPAQLRATLRAQADDSIGSAGYDPESGFGELRMIVPDAMAGGGNLAPVADIAGDENGRIVVEDTGKSGSERVTLDGSASFDPDGTVVDYRWSWLDDGGVIRNASGSALTVDLVTGPSYYFTLIVEDDDGAISSGSTVEVNVAPKTKDGGGKGGGGGGRGGGPKPR